MGERPKHFKSWITHGLSQCVLELKYNVTEESEYRVFATRNQQLIEKYYGKSNNLNISGKLIAAYDIKNNIFCTLDLELVDQVSYPGLPFEIFPEYIINSEFEGTIDFDTFYKFQQPIIEELHARNKLLNDKTFENNIIKYSSLAQYNIICNIYHSLTTQFGNINYSFDKKDLESFMTIGPPEYTFYDQQGIEEVTQKYSEFNNSLNEFVTYVSACEVMQVPIKELDSTSSEIMSGAINIWKEKIKEHSNISLGALLEEEEILKKENRIEELKELEFIKSLISEILNEIDFNAFKTPRELASFWPSLLLPAPPFVVYKN
jgi:hypothetical protein